eukprot:235414_1
MMDDSVFVAVFTAEELIPLIISLTFALLFSLQFLCVSAENNDTVHINKYIRWNVLTYIGVYLLYAITSGVDAFGDDYNLYPDNSIPDITIDTFKTLSYCIAHGLFHLLILQRLYYSFKGSVKALSECAYICLLFIVI